ncbi:MAG: hypothetical protein E7445_02240 [Ruminococcaceae bacterium]|nr:hypothetical protein [Oscillospiraceae bacterium]
MKSKICLLLAALLLVTLAACGETQPPAASNPPAASSTPAQPEKPAEPETPAQPEKPAEPETPAQPEKPALTAAEQAVLQQRRDTAEATMRAMATVLWQAQEDVEYSLSSGVPYAEAAANKRLAVRAGRIYRGMIYSYGHSSLAPFMDYAGEPEGLVYPVSGLDWLAVGGKSSLPRIGNDCSGALVCAWNSTGATVPAKATNLMCADNGFLPVGDYVSDPTKNADTHLVTTQQNGEQVMFRAYAQLQKADGVVRRKGSSGHARMVVKAHTEYNADGTINGDRSYIIALEQTSTLQRGEKTVFDTRLQKTVYAIYGVDVKYTYKKLYTDGYLPITCRELIDPAPIPAVQVTDSLTAHSADTILTGTISANRSIVSVSVTVTDGAGNVIAQASAPSIRGKLTAFDMQLLCSGQGVRGSVEPAALKPGSYHCTTVCSLLTGETITVRDFDFIV